MPSSNLRRIIRWSGLLLGWIAFTALASAAFNVRDFGAKGDGQVLDTAAINQAIEAAAAAGGGTVVFPAGTYRSFSIRLRSNLTLQFDAGCILVAATPSAAEGGYDAAEPNEWGDKQYQDFGHSHWHDSLIWGENLTNVTLTGPGLIHGKGISRGGGSRRAQASGPNGTEPTGPGAASAVTESTPPIPVATVAGRGTKTIALKNCRNVTLRDLSILEGGWFALLATGVDNLTIDNLRVDTNRDGFDIDACRNVRISNCLVNAINDDAIVLKSSYALGEPRACENITINGCQVSGFDLGTLLDGTFKRTQEKAPDRDGPTGRIKFGTESNGGFKNIAITNCVFVRCRGLAIETVDGAVIEDVSITNITMRDIVNSPIFLRLGNRARGPEGTKPGVIRRVSISHVVASNCDPRYPILIAGLPDHPVEDVRLQDIRVSYRGGVTMEHVAQQPAALVNRFFLRGPGLADPRDPFNPPENEKGYPEPSMFGLLPAYGLFARHATGLTVDGLVTTFETSDERAPVVLMDVGDVVFSGLKAHRAEKVPMFVLRKVRNFESRSTVGLVDAERDLADSDAL